MPVTTPLRGTGKRMSRDRSLARFSAWILIGSGALCLSYWFLVVGDSWLYRFNVRVNRDILFDAPYSPVSANR